MTVRAPSVDIRTIGAGGGSIAFVPELTKALRVGPDSAGADPGPAAYMKGGELPTVCDANVVLGYLPSDVKLGGKMTINRDAAEKAAPRRVRSSSTAAGRNIDDLVERVRAAVATAAAIDEDTIGVDAGNRQIRFAIDGERRIGTVQNVDRIARYAGVDGSLNRREAGRRAVA